MKTFTIENNTNNITVHASGKDAAMVPDSERFSNEAALAKLAANWPAARLVDIWNSLPGVTPVNKFKDRPTAIGRIWKALQTLGEAAPAAEEPAPVPEVAAEFAEAAPVPEPAASETVQSEAGLPESTEPAVATPVAPQTAHHAPKDAPAKKKARRSKNAPKPATSAKGSREGSKTAQLIEMLKRPAAQPLMKSAPSSSGRNTPRGP